VGERSRCVHLLGVGRRSENSRCVCSFCLISSRAYWVGTINTILTYPTGTCNLQLVQNTNEKRLSISWQLFTQRFKNYMYHFYHNCQLQIWDGMQTRWPLRDITNLYCLVAARVSCAHTCTIFCRREKKKIYICANIYRF